MTKWQDINPIGHWILVKADNQQKSTSGGILLMEDLPGSVSMSYYTGDVLKYGEKVLDFLNINRDLPLTSADLSSKKLIYKHYLSEVIKFLCKDEDERDVFLINIADPNLNIIGLSEGEKIELI